MEIRVNGKAVETSEGIRLAALLGQLESPLEGVAVAINLAVVPKVEWNNRVLQQGDTIEIVRAVGGG
tara:strand:- start:393 stop:593 length:201 start_codon:yes stop_codon:yes gene_type:complete